jgi:hypothetical protein
MRQEPNILRLRQLASSKVLEKKMFPILASGLKLAIKLTGVLKAVRMLQEPNIEFKKDSAIKQHPTGVLHLNFLCRAETAGSQPSLIKFQGQAHMIPTQ